MEQGQKKESQRIMLSKRLIKEALLDLLKTTSISKISIRELCLVAQINRSTFYNHYGSQYDVLHEIANDFIENTSYRIMRCLAENHDFEQTLVDVLYFILEKEDFVKLILGQPNYVITSHINVPIPQFATFITDRLSNDVPMESRIALSTFIQFGTLKVLESWILSENRITPEEEVKILISIWDHFSKMELYS